MNIFWLEPFDGRPVKEVLRLNAQQHLNSWVGKLQVEAVQIMSASNLIHNYPCAYAMSHGRNNLNIWASECLENWILLYYYVEALEEERHYRYHTGGVYHKSYLAMKKMRPSPNMKRNGKPTLPPCAMPDKYKTRSLITSYRNYVIGEKQHIAYWGNRDEPEWFNREGILLPDEPREFDREQELREYGYTLNIPRNGTRIN